MALLAVFLSACGCNGRPEATNNLPSTNRSEPAKPGEGARRVREPAVAGAFYPGDQKTLARTVDALLEGAPEHHVPRLRALVSPHAGYEFSGPTAAIGYKTLAGRDIRTFIILGPSHYALWAGAGPPDAEAYRTPLGLVPISEKAKRLAAIAPFSVEHPCFVQRPEQLARLSGKVVAPGQDTPETWEHSVEVQVPFLQRAATNFEILPILLGEADAKEVAKILELRGLPPERSPEATPAQVAKVLADFVDDKTIVVASSDLSHYHSYDEAKGLDSRCVKAICDLNIDAMESQEACGKKAILSLMHLAKLKGWKARLLDARNSGDVTGDKARVVGYSSVAFYEPGAENYGPAERKSLLELARRTLARVAADHASPGPEVDARSFSPKLAETRGCFVTLTKRGTLRGCIGHILPQEALCLAVRDNARNAAVRDPRFPPVQPEEVADIKIEISVLTEPQPLAFRSPQELLDRLQPLVDGVVLRIGPYSATFLPQVWAQLPSKTDFLDHLAQKAGCEPAAWRGKDASVSIYHVECFEEE